MVAPMFILTRTFAISALFVGAFPVTYAAPIPTEVATSASIHVPRWCRQMGCLYALPEGSSDSSDTGDATNATAATSLSPSADASTSALQILDLLVSALQSAASSLRQSSSTKTASTSLDAKIPSVAETSAADGDVFAAVAAAIASVASPPAQIADGEVTPSSDKEEASVPAVEVVGFSTISSTEVRGTRLPVWRSLAHSRTQVNAAPSE
ncbi:hypothetical protein C8Q77DRAFT_1065208 [Trametes polyzona]|nr:hypothetical protein C8Q77DRAFT_1065208 [Trametes polyzona]